LLDKPGGKKIAAKYLTIAQTTVNTLVRCGSKSLSLPLTNFEEFIMKITMTALAIVAAMVATAPDALAQIVPFKSVGTDNEYIADPENPNAGQFIILRLQTKKCSNTCGKTHDLSSWVIIS
jgi:hypothetical protein